MLNLSKTDLKAWCDPLHGSPYESDFLDHTRQLHQVSNAQDQEIVFKVKCCFWDESGRLVLEVMFPGI